jgi:hypothetical protein
MAKATSFLFALLVGSPLAVSPASMPELAGSVWVPQTIHWERPLPHDPELRHIRYASFPVLSFRSPGQCLVIHSTHSLGKANRILVATEPGFRVDSGAYRQTPRSLVLTTRTAYALMGKPENPLPGPPRTDTLRRQGPHIWFRGVKYQRCTQLGGRSMDSFWAGIAEKR